MSVGLQFYKLVAIHSILVSLSFQSLALFTELLMREPTCFS